MTGISLELAISDYVCMNYLFPVQLLVLPLCKRDSVCACWPKTGREQRMHRCPLHTEGNNQTKVQII
jgi:hypothetical protein